MGRSHQPQSFSCNGCRITPDRLHLGSFLRMHDLAIVLFAVGSYFAGLFFCCCRFLFLYFHFLGISDSLHFALLFDFRLPGHLLLFLFLAVCFFFCLCFLCLALHRRSHCL